MPLKDKKEYNAYMKSYRKSKQDPKLKSIKKSIKKIKKDKIDGQIENQAIKVKQTTHKRRESSILDDEWGNDVDVDFECLRNNDSLNQYMKDSKPTEKQKPQYQKTEDPYQFDFWGNKHGNTNPLDSISNQKNLRNMFGEGRCE